MNAFVSFFNKLLAALSELIDPPTTTVSATVISKQFGKVSLERPLFSEDNQYQSPILIDVPMLTVTLAGVSGSREIRVPQDLYHAAIIGQTIPVEIRPSRVMPEYTHVDYSPAF